MLKPLEKNTLLITFTCFFFTSTPLNATKTLTCDECKKKAEKCTNVCDTKPNAALARLCDQNCSEKKLKCEKECK